MKDMTLSTNISRLEAVYYFRRRIPKDVIEAFGKKEFKVSLRTKDHIEAKKLVALKAVEFDDLVEQYRNGLVNDALETSSASKERTNGLTPAIDPQSYYHQIRLEEDQRRSDVFAQVSADVDGFIEGKYITHPEDAYYYKLSEEGHWDRLLSYCFKWKIRDRLSQLRTARNIGDFSAHKQLAGGDLRLGRALLEAEINALDDILDQSVAGGRSNGAGVKYHKVTKAATAPLASDAPLLSVAVREWIETKSKKWTQKTRISREKQLGSFIGFIGDKPVDHYMKKDAREFMGVLGHLPPNWTKRLDLKGLSLANASKKSQKLGLVPSSPKTVNTILSACGTFFIWLCKTGDLIDKNPFAGIRVEYKHNPRTERDPFSVDEIKIILASNEFANLSRESALYWVPLIALYSGMRLQEICQLYVGDIKQSDGIWFVDVNDEQADKNLKSNAAHRKIPIHQALIDVGFLDFVKHRKLGNQNSRIFPDSTMAQDGYYSSNFSKKYSYFLKKIGVKRSKLSFLSYRHTFEDALRAAQVDHHVMNALQGHASGDMSDRYGSGYPIKVLNEAVQKVEYPGVVLRK